MKLCDVFREVQNCGGNPTWVLIKCRHKLCLDQSFSTRVFCPAGAIWQCPEVFLVVTTGGWSWHLVRARDAAQHPTKCGVVPALRMGQPQTSPVLRSTVAACPRGLLAHTSL